MVEAIDIWRTASALVSAHGGDAVIVAAQSADRHLAQGDMDGVAVWKRVLAAVKELQDQSVPPADAALN
ncbi:MAG: hypothetical protein RLQ25_10855 [Alphaproteobacteria bacterium]|uniref:hypothetical protein n=1 Tax=Marinobacter salarius TaxID=1420917 RepID=UPI0032F091F6